MMVSISQEQCEAAKAVSTVKSKSVAQGRPESGVWNAKVHSEAKVLLQLGLITQDEATDMHFALERIRNKQEALAPPQAVQ